MESPPPPPESSNATIRPDLLIRVKRGSITESITNAFTSLPARFRRRQPSGSPSPSSPPHRPSHALLKMVSKITLKDIQGAKQCGEGGFGTVRIFEHPTKGKVALKQLRVSAGQLSDDVRRRTLREGETWQGLTHPHILPFLGVLETPTDLYLVSPYVKNGALDEYLRQNPNANRQKFLWKAAGAIAYLHEHGIIHGDIKAANILVSDDVEPLLCDFGLAKCDDGVTSVGLQGVGTIRFQSPEILTEGGGKSFASDVWAFGMTIFEVLSGQLPFHQDTIPMAIIGAIVLWDERPPKLPSHSRFGLSYDRIWSVAEECWQKDPALRPSMPGIHLRLRPDGITLRGHTAPITCLVISPDSSTIVSGSGHTSTEWFADRSPDYSLRLWDIPSGTQRGEPLRGHTQKIRCLAISPDGKIMVSGSEDCNIRLWGMASGGQRGGVLRGHTGAITCLEISPDGLIIVSGSEDFSLRLWDTASGRQRGETLEGHPSSITCLTISPDGLTIVSGSGHTSAEWSVKRSPDYSLLLWDIASGTQRGQPLRGHLGKISCLAISPDGMTIVSGSWDCSILLWNMASGRQRGEVLRGHTGAITCLAISPDGLTVVSGSGNGSISGDYSLRVWDIISGNQRGESLRGHAGVITSLAISPDGSTIVSGEGDGYLSKDHSLRFWDMTSGRQRGEPLTTHTGKITSLAISPDGLTTVFGSYDGTLQLLNRDPDVFKPDLNGRVLEIA